MKVSQIHLGKAGYKIRHSVTPITYSAVYLCNLLRKDEKELNQEVTNCYLWMVGSRVISLLFFPLNLLQQI